MTTDLIHYDTETDEWVGCVSKHREYAHTDMLSVDCEGELSYGYDGDFYTPDFTAEERKALADIMIARWQAWKEKQ